MMLRNLLPNIHVKWQLGMLINPDLYEITVVVVVNYRLHNDARLHDAQVGDRDPHTRRFIDVRNASRVNQAHLLLLLLLWWLIRWGNLAAYVDETLLTAVLLLIIESELFVLVLWPVVAADFRLRLFLYASSSKVSLLWRLQLRRPLQHRYLLISFFKLLL